MFGEIMSILASMKAEDIRTKILKLWCLVNPYGQASVAELNFSTKKKVKRRKKFGFAEQCSVYLESNLEI